jgi:hypothetical protein
MLQAKNYITRYLRDEHRVKLTKYKQVLKQSGAAGQPALGAGNERVLLSYDGLTRLVEHLLKAQSAPEMDVGETISSTALDSGGDNNQVHDQLQWLQGGDGCKVLEDRSEWNLTAYGAMHD